MLTKTRTKLNKNNKLTLTRSTLIGWHVDI